MAEVSAGFSSYPVQVLNIGARTSVGTTAETSTAAIQAGIVDFREHPYLIDKHGQPVRAAYDRLLDIDTRLQDRLIEIGQSALLEAIQPLLSEEKQNRIALIVGLPVDFNSNLDYQLIAKNLLKNIPDTITFDNIQLIHHGHASGLEAINVAQIVLQNNQADYCIVGAVDSYISSDIIEWMDLHDRLASRNNPWGFVPGEGGCFILLGQSIEKEAGARIVSSALAIEPDIIDAGTVSLGLGLTQAFEKALSVLPAAEEKIDHVYGDLNGSRYRADEYGMTILRMADRIASPDRFTCPAQSIGDTGAVAGLLNIALAVRTSRSRQVENNKLLIWSGSDSGQRAAVVLQVSFTEMDGSQI